MASKQLNFITPDDFGRINELILEKEILVLYNENITSTSDFDFLNKLPNIEDEIFQVYLTSRRFMDKILIRSTDKILMRHSLSHLLFSFVI